MLLSIVIPTYNVEKFIGNCLDSLLDQNVSKEDYEILVINDGSTDDSAIIVFNYTTAHKNVKLICQDNKGLSGARNTGIKHAQGKYIYFIDSDDYVAKNTFSIILTILEEHQLDILCVKAINTSQLDLTTSSNINSLNTSNLIITDGITFIAENNYLNNAWWYFIRTEFLVKTGLTFPIGRLVEDANFTAKLLASAERMCFLPLDFYRYNIRPNSIMRQKNIDHIKRLVNDYEKNVYEFEEQIQELKKIEHPKKDTCIKRLETRQQSFVFFLLIKSIKFNFSKEEISQKLYRLKQMDAYPIKKFLGKDYHKISYKILTIILNNEKLLFMMLKINSITKGFLVK